MLSKTQVVKTRKAIERLYTHTCTVVIKQKVKKADHSTSFTETKLVENQPCRLSFSSVSVVSDTSHASLKEQEVKLFISPEINIEEGSKIIVNHDGIESLFSKSGVPAVYPTHQEIKLDVFKDWA